MLISKIRKYSWVAVALITLCLVAFLVQDATNSNTGMFNKHKAPEYATIAGEEVTQDEFASRRGESMLEYLTFNNQVLAYEQGQYQIDAATQFGIGEQAWNDYVNEKLLEKELDKMGLAVTEDEFTEIIYGADPHPVIKNYYIGLSQTGKYDASLLPTWVNQISDQEAQQNNPQLRQEYYQFISREKVAKRDYLQSKYMTLFTQGIYVPEWMAKHNYNVANKRTTFAFVTLPFTGIADSTVKVSDSEIKNYYNENKNKYKQTEGRVIEYVSWDFLPTAADSATTLKLLNESVEKMKASKSDSVYIVTRSEDADKYGNSNYSRGDFYTQGIDSSIVDSFFAKPVGSLVGPFFNNGFYKVAKIKNRENLPDSVDLRHILISVNENRDSITAKKLVDSLQAVLANDTSAFAILAMGYSDDAQSKTKGGELGWLTPAVNYAPAFKDYIFKTGQEGKIGMIKTDYGYQIIQIKDIKNKKDFVNIVYLSKYIVPGKETIDSIEKLAGNFYDKYQSPEKFDEGVTSMRIQKKVTQPLQKSQFEIPGLDGSRDMITWAYDAQKNEFKYFSMSNRIVVAYLKDLKVNGIADLENVRDQVEQEVINIKKGDMLKKKFDDAMKGGASLQSIAQKMNLRIDTVQNTSMANPYGPIIGLEPKVIGTVFGLEPGKVSKTIVGNRGVYVVTAINVTPAAETTDFTLNKNQLTYSIQNKFQGQGQGQGQGILIELKDKAEVQDNRYQFGD